MMASGLWVGDVLPELAEVSVGELASLGDESFWKLAASQYDDHEFDSFDVDDRFPVARNISADRKYHGRWRSLKWIISFC